MEEGTYVYDGTSEGLRKVCELHPKGVRILCPKCGADLIVALDYESANKHKVHTGIYCPRSRKHIWELIEFSRRDFWKRFEGHTTQL